MSFPANAAHPPHSGVKQEPTISSQPQPAPRHQQQQRQQQHQPAPPASGSKRNVRCAAHLQRTLATGDFKSHFVSGRQAPASSASSAAAAAAEYAGCKQCETGPYFIAVHVACHAVFVRAYGEEKQQGVQQNNTQQTSSIGGLSLSLSSYSGTTGDHHKRSPVAGFVADATASSGSVSGYDETKGGVEYEYEAMRALWTEAIWREPWARAGPVTGIFRGGGKGSRPPPPWTPGVAARDSADRARLVSWALRPGGPVVPDSVRGGRGGLVLPPELMGNIAQLLTGGSNDHDDGVSLWTLLPAVSLAGRIVCVQREEATAAERTRQFQRQQQQQQQEESQCRSLQSLQSCRASPNTSTGAMAPVLLQNIVYWHRGDSGRGELVLLSDDAESRQKWLRARRREMLLNRPRRMSPAAYAAAAAAASHPQASAVAASVLVDEFRQPMPNGSVPDDSVMTLVFDAYGLREIARGTEELRSRGPTSFAYMTYPVAVFCHTTVQFRHGRARLDFTATSKCSDIVCLDETRWLAGALALWQDPYWTWGKGLDPERGGPAMYRPRPGLLGCPEIKWRWRAGAWEWAYPHESLLPVEATVTRLADKLALWNTPNPPDLKACRFFPSDLAGLPQRFHCIPLENSSVRGITFFFAGGVLVAIHPHWAETAGGGYGEDVNTSMDGGDALQRYRRLMGGTGVTDTASSTYRRIAKRVDPNIAWVYLPIGPLDPIVLLGTRAALLDTRREQNCFSWTYSVVVWTERTGAIELGAQLGTAKATDCSTLLGSGDPVRLVYREPPEGKPIHCIGAVCLDPHGGPMERNEDDEPQPRVDSAFPQRNADHESSAEQLIGPGAYCSSAPLDHVTRAELYMEAGTGLARGMVMNYKDGSVRAVGECRVGIDPSIVVHDPWALCVRREWTTTAAAAGAAGVDVAVTSGKPPDSPTPRPATMTEGRRRRTTRVILLGRGEYHPVGHRADSRWVCWHMIGLICWYYRMDSSLVVIRES